MLMLMLMLLLLLNGHQRGIVDVLEYHGINAMVPWTGLAAHAVALLLKVTALLTAFTTTTANYDLRLNSGFNSRVQSLTIVVVVVVVVTGRETPAIRPTAVQRWQW